MPFEGPQGQGPFQGHDDCVESMEDEEGVTDPDALCAAWERQATGKSERFDELSRERLLRAAADHPELIGTVGVEQKGTSLGARLRELIDEQTGDDRDRDDVVDDIAANSGGMDRSTINAIIEGEIECPPPQRFQAFAEPLDTAASDLQAIAADEDGCEYPEQELTPRQKATASTTYDTVGPSLPTLDKEADGFDPDALSEAEQTALEADDFVIYGKASIEQYDVEDQRITIDALEAALDRFFESEDAPGIISRGHADVPVGMPVREHTLDADTTLVIDGEQYAFSAGDTLRTETKDADDDGLPELWLVSRLANDSELARETRLRALAGDLNGYSVTVYPRDGEQTAKGDDVTALDLHAVTIGSDEQIKNKGSEFDVAEFKARFGALSAAARTVASTLSGQLTMDEDEQSLLARLLKRSGEELEQEAQSDGTDEGTAPEGDAGDESLASPIFNAVEEDQLTADQATKLDDAATKMDAAVVKPIIDAISEEDLDVENAVDMLNAMSDSDGGDDTAVQNADDEDDDEDEDDEMEHKDDAGELKAAAEEAVGDVVAEQVADKLDAALDERLPDDLATTDDIDQKLESVLEGLDEEVLTKEEAVELGLLTKEDGANDDGGVLKKAETTVVGSPVPTESTGDETDTLGDSVPLGGD